MHLLKGVSFFHINSFFHMFAYVKMHLLKVFGALLYINSFFHMFAYVSFVRPVKVLGAPFPYVCICWMGFSLYKNVLDLEFNLWFLFVCILYTLLMFIFLRSRMPTDLFLFLSNLCCFSLTSLTIFWFSCNVYYIYDIDCSCTYLVWSLIEH